jgi:hypothetical protein
MADTKIDTSVLGSTGLTAGYGGRLAYDPHYLLRTDGGRTLYREMADNDAVIGAVLYIVTTHLRQVQWTARPAIEGDEQAARWAEFVTSCMTDMSHTWPDFISEVLTFLQYGWSLFEKCFKQRQGPDGEIPSKHNDGLWGWRKLSIRPPDTLDRWEFDDQMGIQGMWQRKAGSGMDEPVLIPIERALLFRTVTHGNHPEGRSFLRNAVRSYCYLKRLQEVEAITAERDGTGLPHMTVPLSCFNEDDPNHGIIEKLQGTVNDVRGDKCQGIITPAESEDGQATGFSFKLVASGGSRAVNLDAIIRRYESRIAMGFLAEFVLLGTDKTGSYALASSKKDVFAVSLSAILQNIAAVINDYGVAQLCAINGCPPEMVPTLVPGDVAAPALGEVVAAIQSMASVGMLTADGATEARVRELVGLPPAEEEDLPGLEDEDEGTEVPTPGPDDEVGVPMPGEMAGAAIGDAAGKTVAAVTLNGAQVDAARSIIQDVISGTMPVDTAEALMQVAFALSDDQVRALLKPLARFRPPPPPADVVEPPAGGGA